MSTIITLTEDEFVENFQPIRNHLNPNASFDWGDGFGTLFETYGEEVQFIASQPTEHVWTLLDTDDGLCIVSGWHFVNRLGYFVTVVPVSTELTYEVGL